MFASLNVLLLWLVGHFALMAAGSVFSLTDSSVRTGNLCGKIWPNNRRFVQKGECPVGGGSGRECWLGMSWLLAAALQVHVMILCSCFLQCNSLLSFCFSFSEFSFFLFCLNVSYHFFLQLFFLSYFPLLACIACVHLTTESDLT